ncbi:MAG: TIGR01777 family oxidoreductase [Alphaproteobacteria bacterium]
MRLVIAGASGFIGLLLLDRLSKQGHSLKLLTRKPCIDGQASEKDWIVWQPGIPGEWEKCVDGVDGVINLAGEPIAAKRWTERQKEKIRSSRIETTRSLVNAIAKAQVKPKFLINASAVGFYGARGDELLSEGSAPGKGYLAGVCIAWEEEAKRAEQHGVRVALLRTGIVLGKGRGALAKMVPPFKFFLGGPLGSGRQWMPWIHIEDEIGMILFLMENEEASGAFNATAPNPVTMKDFSKALGNVLHRPSWAPVPAFALALMLGEMADMLVSGQRALPDAALRLGYRFKYPTIDQALQSLGL